MFNPYPNLPHQVRNYVLNSIIGQGASSIVYKATNVLYNIDFAVKVVFKSNISERNTLTYEAEVNSLIKLDHPNVIHLYDFFNEGPNMFLVLEYCGGGTLEDKIAKYEDIAEDMKVKICIQIISALKYCYDMSIAHHDIKTANILFDNNGRIKVADFGLSNIYNHDENINEHKGTLSYSAPEVLKMSSFNPFISDIWSLGVLFYRLFTYSYPFEGKSKEKLIGAIMKGYYPDKLVGPIKKVVRRMIVVNPDERITIEKLSKIDFFAHSTKTMLHPIFSPKILRKDSLNIKLSKRRSSLIYNQKFDDKLTKSRRCSLIKQSETFSNLP